MIDAVTPLLKLAEDAVADGKATLGPAATMNPYQAPLAATILGTYAAMFERPTEDLQELANILSDTRSALTS